MAKQFEKAHVSDNTYTDLLEAVESARTDVRDAARSIRNCPDARCDQGYIQAIITRNGIEYEAVKQHHCLLHWRTACRALKEAAKDYEKSMGEPYTNLITSDMEYHTRPTINPVPYEDMAYWRQQLEKQVGYEIPQDIRDFARGQE
jgi:hypothetical protein